MREAMIDGVVIPADLRDPREILGYVRGYNAAKMRFCPDDELVKGGQGRRAKDLVFEGIFCGVALAIVVLAVVWYVLMR